MRRCITLENKIKDALSFIVKSDSKKIDLDFPSVGATENAILASCLATRKNNYN